MKIRLNNGKILNADRININHNHNHLVVINYPSILSHITGGDKKTVNVNEVKAIF